MTGTVVVAGALANKPHSGGEAWVRLSWVLGLRDLGLDVRLVEEIAPQTCTDATGRPTDPALSDNVAYFRRVTTDFGIADVSTLLVGGDAVVGSALSDLLSFAESAVLVNISGHLASPRLLRAFRSRVYVDIDPGFTQFWHALGQLGTALDDHDQHVTIGENIGTSACSIPTGGFDWRPVRQPVLLDRWPATASPTFDRFTTITTWRPPFGPIDYQGRSYGLKLHEFRRFLELPGWCGHDFELALDIHPGDDADRRRLLQEGWTLVDPRAVSATPETFRHYVQNSGAEFSVAQGVYVDTHSGWFSDRTARYLASGRPALVQETGFSRNLPVGSGLLSFATMGEAVLGAEAIARDYATHAAAARQIAEDHFSSARVLARFADEVGI